MTWAILLAFVVVGGLVSVSGRKQVAWIDRLRRVNAGVRSKGEWMAPEDITQTVEEHYLTSMDWLHNSMLDDWSSQWDKAPYFLAGQFLRRHQEILKRYRMGTSPRYAGIMRCTHRVEVRHFSDDGERCLVVDYQSTRRIATYDIERGNRVMTQDLGDGAVVHQMVYDKQSKRWKIDAFIQELPVGWQANNREQKIKLLSALPPANGRDH